MRSFASHNPIGKDLEEHARKQTIDRLQTQGQQFRDFNEQVVMIVEPKVMKQQIQAAQKTLMTKKGIKSSDPNVLQRVL